MAAAKKKEYKKAEEKAKKPVKAVKKAEVAVKKPVKVAKKAAKSKK